MIGDAGGSGSGESKVADYFRVLNEMVAVRSGDAHKSRVVLHSMNQHDFTSRAASADPNEIISFRAAQVALLKAGRGVCFLLCANGGPPLRLSAAVVGRAAGYQHCRRDGAATDGIRRAASGIAWRETDQGRPFYRDKLRAHAASGLSIKPSFAISVSRWLLNASRRRQLQAHLQTA